ncbi:hypothetical protein T458_00045 [Brevibacillus panacihumi W25]|uniref:TniQ domain-containing protein n=1 Tax=Brevibacillus panacihumi W25 TaxID=1408254 RepID=V6MDV1_9BACL|nr:TniQ family protein [Brevibacillus panacihumi]EST56704.1 hypothetical protein T458_00045 [Brevibacillus panacihumi W25]
MINPVILTPKYITKSPYDQLTKENIFTWRSEWVAPFESPWSIIEKFKFANEMSSKQFLKEFGIEHVKSLKANIGTCHRDLTVMQGLDDILIQKTFQLSIKKHNDYLIQKMIGYLPYGGNKLSPIRYLRKQLVLCPACVSNGFHSLLHQFSLIHACPYHKIPLMKSCPKCGDGYPYELSDKTMVRPFTCHCGNEYFKVGQKELYYSKWGKNITYNLSCEKVRRWFALTNQSALKFTNIFFFTEQPLDQTNGLLDYLLTIACPNLHSSRDEKHFSVKTSKFILSIKGHEEKLEHRKYSQHSLPHRSEYAKLERRFQTFQRELYKGFTQTIKAVARHLRKKVLPRHKTCIRRFVQYGVEDCKCPYAYAYVFWRQFVHQFPFYFYVDNKHSPHRHYKNRIEFPNDMDSGYLYKLYNAWESNFDDITLTSLAATKWVLNRNMVHLLLSHFNDWLRVSMYYVENKRAPKSEPFHYENLPYFINIISTYTDQPLEFHWWKREEHSLSHLLLQLECPYSTVKQRRKPPYDPEKRTIGWLTFMGKFNN